MAYDVNSDSGKCTVLLYTIKVVNVNHSAKISILVFLNQDPPPPFVKYNFTQKGYTLKLRRLKSQCFRHILKEHRLFMFL